MRRAWRIGLLVLLLLPLLLLGGLRVGLLTPVVNLALAWKGPSAVRIRLGSFRSDILHFIEIDDLVVVAPAGKIKLPLLTVQSLRLEYLGWSALRGRIDRSEALRLARVRGLSVFLLREDGGRWNVSGLGGKPVTPTAKAPSAWPLLPAARVELEDSQIVLNDEARGFHSGIDHLQGSLDTRSLPLIAFSLNGRTEGKARDDLSVAGEFDQRDSSLFGRLDLASVPVARYLNYFLPLKGVRFEQGDASLSVRLRRKGAGELEASGRAEIEDGSVRIPGITEPLTGLQGAVAFDPEALRFREFKAHFLGSDWSATGAINDLRKPVFDVSLSNTAFPMQGLSEQIKGMGLLDLSGTAAVNASLKGPAGALVIDADLQVPDLGLAGVELGAVSARARLSRGSLSVTSLQARLWGGQVHAKGVLGLGRGGGIDADLQLDAADLSQARLHGRRLLPLSGTAGVTMTARGLLKDPSVGMALNVRSAGLGDLALGPISAHAQWSPEGLRSRFDTLDGRLSGSINFGRGKKAAFIGSQVDLQGMDLAQLAHGLGTVEDSLVLPSVARSTGAWLDGKLKGAVNVRLAFKDALSAPAVWIDVALEQGRFFPGEGFFKLDDPKAGLPLRMRGRLGFQGHRLRLGEPGKPFQLRLSRRSRSIGIQALGQFPLRNDAGPGKLEATIDGDMRVLDEFAFFNKSSGRLAGDLTLGGTPDSPEAEGGLTLSGFNTRPAAYVDGIKDGEFELSFTGQQLRLAQLDFKSGGHVQASGSLDLSAGIKGMRGSVEVRTDDQGLRIQNWEEMGSGDLVLDPLTFSVDGEDRPMRLQGKASLSNAVVTYSGRKKKAGAEPVPSGRGLDLDLDVGLGPNVWYEKRQSGGIDSLDPTKLISGIVDSVQETFQRPDFFFRLRPTEQDFSVKGMGADLQLQGELAIDRGRLTLMENNFEIRGDQAARIRFRGRRAEVEATAVARLRYTRDDPLTGRPVQKVVNVIATVRPLPPEQLEQAGLADAFLNYSLSFDSDPKIISGDETQQQEAILNLVVLGDPLVDQNEPGVAAGSQSSGSRLSQAQINRLLMGEIRRQAAKISRKGIKILGSRVFDVFRVVPRLKYQAASNNGARGSTAADASGQDSTFAFSDISMELGKSLFERLYLSIQGVWYRDPQLNVGNNGVVNSNQIVRDWGGRFGVEYQISANRTAELYFNYSVDDNLEPVPFDPNDISQARSIVFRLRNAIPTDTYTPALARERRWDLQGKEVP